MSLQIADLKTDREWSAATSFKKQEFYDLLTWFSKGYLAIYTISIEKIQENLKQEFSFSTYQELLFFVLFTLKNPTTYDVNGIIFGISQSASEQNFKKGLLILKKAIELAQQLPTQSFSDEQALVAVHSKPELRNTLPPTKFDRPDLRGPKRREPKRGSGPAT